MDFLHEIEQRLDMTVADKIEVMRELADHFNELYDSLLACRMGPAEAKAQAEKQMGSPMDIAARLNAAHYTASWKSALLTIVPFGASVAYLAACTLGLVSSIKTALIVAIGVVMVAASTRELVAGRRPLWLTTWLAAGLVCVLSLFVASSGSISGKEAYAALRTAASLSLVFAGIVLIVSLVTRRYMKPVAVSALIAVCATAILLITIHGKSSPYFGVPAVYALINAAAHIVLLVLFAKIVFQTHAYGNALQAVLFLLSMFAIRLGPPPTPALGWAQAIGVVFSALAVLWFARAPRRATKAFACYLALLAYVLPGHTITTALQKPETIPANLFFAALSAAVYHIICVSPMLQIMRREVDRLRVAR